MSIAVEDIYETVNDREIRQVFEGQNRIHLEIKQLHRQLAMILDEQRRYVSVITEEIAKKGTAAESGQVGRTAVARKGFTPDAHVAESVLSGPKFRKTSFTFITQTDAGINNTCGNFPIIKHLYIIRQNSFLCNKNYFYLDIC